MVATSSAYGSRHVRRKPNPLVVDFCLDHVRQLPIGFPDGTLVPSSGAAAEITTSIATCIFGTSVEVGVADLAAVGREGAVWGRVASAIPVFSGVQLP